MVDELSVVRSRLKSSYPQAINAVMIRSVSTTLLHLITLHRLVGLVVKESASRVEDLGFQSRLLWDFTGVESYQ